METAQPSTTAMMVAVSRDDHRSYDAPPWILDDPYARDLVGPSWRDIRVSCQATFREPVRRQVRASLVARSRYAEDRLVAGPYRQYVILGAGLDSFAWRHPDLLGALRLFEIDHPATQTWKRARIDDLGLAVHDEHVFAPIDFETGTLRSGLDRAGFDWSQPAFFSWLGVTVYLTTEAIEATLHTVADCGPGSEIVLSYDATASFRDDLGREMMEAESNLLASVGEPYSTLFSPTHAEALVEHCGLEVAEHLTPDVLHDRYFLDRSDGLRPSTAERLIAARVRG
jgi:methyltransferase (TIGR00027 family)